MAPDLNFLPHSPYPVTEPSLFSASSEGATPSVSSENGQSRPNILYIMADQLAAPLLKMHNAQSQIRTPNLDALAEKAVVFDSAYCPSPLCAPSRMSMVTGQLPTKIGAYDNACEISSTTPTYAHYLRRIGYETVLAGKMHFIGDQLHGYERRLTADIYPGDYGWAVNWDEPDTRLEWYHNASSILQAGPCVRSNQLDYDEEVMYKSTQFLYDHVRQGASTKPFCLTLSLTHPHDPYTIEKKYWDMYEDVDIELPKVQIPREQQDPHSKRLLNVCDLWDKDICDDQVKRARRAYYGAVSYVDDCIGRILKVLRDCSLDENTIIVFSGDHGDMLGRGGYVRVPLLVHYPQQFAPRRVSENVSTLDILPTLVDLVSAELDPIMPIDGHSLYPLLKGETGNDTVFAEYAGEGTISPMMMIRRGQWKYIICPVDPEQLYDLSQDPLEIHNLAKAKAATGIVESFRKEALKKWDFKTITADILKSQRQRRFVWKALKQGKYTSWDFNPEDDGREKYVRSHLPLDELELRARFPPVDAFGRERSRVVAHQAGAFGQ